MIQVVVNTMVRKGAEYRDIDAIDFTVQDASTVRTMPGKDLDPNDADSPST
jgi:hypothetical protein